MSGPIYLVGGKLSIADVLLFECTLMLEEKFASILADFRNVKVKAGYTKEKLSQKKLFVSVLLTIISEYQNVHPILNPPFKDDFLYFLLVFPGQDDPDSCYRQVPAARQQEEATAR